jgi:hypothetical protein
VKNQIELNISMLIGLIFVLTVFPFSYVHAEKFQSGVTIASPGATTPPAGTCPDSDGNGVNDMTGAPCTSPTGPAAGTCGLQLVSGVPINYGQLAPGQPSAEKQVMIKNTGNSQTPAKFTIKGGNWVSDAAPNPTISGPEVTRVAIAPVDFNNKKALSLAGWELGQMTGGQTIPVYFQFLAWVNAPSGSFHQDVTIDLLC